MSILVFNAGSSTLKFEVFDDDASKSLGGGALDWAASRDEATIRTAAANGREWREQVSVPNMAAAVSHSLDGTVRTGLLSSDYREVTSVGHRVVHGGTHFQAAARIDDSARKAIAELGKLAPLHNPPALEGIQAAEEQLPRVPHVAAFDTTYFARLPPRAYLYPTPYEWFEQWGIRRFGFHGISHEYCATRADEMLRSGAGRLIVCHIGHGCSATAIRDGDAVATTMGFTPLEGLMMGTRSGSIDPGVMMYVQEKHGVTPAKLDEALNRHSGLLGVSGVSADFRRVEAAAAEGNRRAQLALEMYGDRIRAAVGSLATALGGIDTLVFTAGVGENSPTFRASVCGGLEHLGLRLDPGKNTTCKPDCDVASKESAARLLVLHTQEALMIARMVRALSN